MLENALCNWQIGWHDFLQMTGIKIDPQKLQVDQQNEIVGKRKAYKLS